MANIVNNVKQGFNNFSAHQVDRIKRQRRRIDRIKNHKDDMIISHSSNPKSIAMLDHGRIKARRSPMMKYMREARKLDETRMSKNIFHPQSKPTSHQRTLGRKFGVRFGIDSHWAAHDYLRAKHAKLPQIKKRLKLASANHAYRAEGEAMIGGMLDGKSANNGMENGYTMGLYKNNKYYKKTHNPRIRQRRKRRFDNYVKKHPYQYNIPMVRGRGANGKMKNVFFISQATRISPYQHHVDRKMAPMLANDKQHIAMNAFKHGLQQGTPLSIMNSADVDQDYVNQQPVPDSGPKSRIHRISKEDNKASFHDARIQMNQAYLHQRHHSKHAKLSGRSIDGPET